MVNIFNYNYLYNQKLYYEIKSLILMSYLYHQLSSRSREIYSLSPSSGSPLTNGNIHNIMVLSPSVNRSLKRKSK